MCAVLVLCSLATLETKTELKLIVDEPELYHTCVREEHGEPEQHHFDCRLNQV